MSEIRLRALMKVRSDRLAEFKAFVSELVETVKAEDTGTLDYGYYHDEAAGLGVFFEHYESSEALLSHIQHMGARLGRFAEFSENAAPTEMYGEPSPELVKTISGWGQVKIYRPLATLAAARTH